MSTLNKFKPFGALLIALGALLFTPGSAHAGGVYLNFYYYSWQPTFVTPLYASDSLGQDGTWTYFTGGYEYAGFGSEEIDNLGPNNPAIIIAGTEHIYEGGPDNGAQSSFLSSGVIYWEPVSGYHQATTVPNGPTTVVLYTEAYPVDLAPASVPH